jgi:hypothetical protein
MLCPRVVSASQSPLAVTASWGSHWMVFLPAIYLLYNRLADEIPETVVMVISVDDAHEVLVVSSLDPTSD